jgi:NTP pyrophosphatase (non-canonical NTP hydrolase)
MTTYYQRNSIEDFRVPFGLGFQTAKDIHVVAQADGDSGQNVQLKEIPVSQGMTFSRFAQANRSRCERWYPEGIESWDLNKWMVAITGELGEAANKLKKLNRLEDKLVGNKGTVSEDPFALIQDIAEEIADVVIYADLFIQCAAEMAVNPKLTLEQVIRTKFNEVSERNGFPERL